MPTKCTMLIQVSTIGPSLALKRASGFTESWYTNDALSPTLETKFLNLATARAALLPSSGSIVGFRYQAVTGLTAGRSTTRDASLPGPTVADTDLPQVAVKFDIDASGSPNQRIWVMRGIPDAQVVLGEFRPSPGYRGLLLAFFQRLQTDSWLWRGQNLTAPVTAVFSISATGAITWFEPPGYAAPTFIRVLRAKNANGRGVGGVFKLLTAVGDSGTLLGWPFGDCTGGKTRLFSIIFPSVPAFTIAPTGVAIPKKVGRPFALFRGRRAKRPIL